MSSMTINLKHSVAVRRLLEKRTRRLGYLQKDMIEDAAKLGKKIDKAALSRFFKKDDHDNYTCEQKGIISEEMIAWLCLRWGISVQIKFSLMPYDENKSIERIKFIENDKTKYDPRRFESVGPRAESADGEVSEETEG